MSQKFLLNVNGRDHTVDVDADMPLLYALRNDVGLNNPHFGCGLAQCGACTVHLNGQPPNVRYAGICGRQWQDRDPCRARHPRQATSPSNRLC